MSLVHFIAQMHTFYRLPLPVVTLQRERKLQILVTFFPKLLYRYKYSGVPNLQRYRIRYRHTLYIRILCIHTYLYT